MRTRRAVMTVAATVTGLLGISAIGSTLLMGGDELDQARTITTTIPDAGQLEIGNEVRSAGVLVGEITDIELVDNAKATITMTVEDGVLPIHDDASLEVRPVNLLGENYVDLNPGSPAAPFMKVAVIPAERAKLGVTLQDVLNTFQAPTAASVAAVVTALGEGLHANGDEVQAAIDALAPAMDDTEALGQLLSRQNDVLGRLVAAVDPVAASLADDNGRTLDELISATEKTLNALARQQVALTSIAQQLPGTLQSAQRTLEQFGGTAREATPTLRAIRPLTGDLEQVVDELEKFADSADPALASLEPVLAEADALLDQAAPLVAQLRRAGPQIKSAAKDLKPVSRALLEENLYGVMEFVRKWALSTNGRDSISHYFRGVVYLTPSSLESILGSLIPTQVDADPTDGVGNQGNTPEVDLPGDLPDVDLPEVPELPDLPDVPDVGLGGLGLRSSTTATQVDPTDALGLSPSQEAALVGQLLGGAR